MEPNDKFPIPPPTGVPPAPGITPPPIPQFPGLPPQDTFIAKEAGSLSQTSGIDPTTALLILSTLRSLLDICILTKQQGIRRLNRAGPMVRLAVAQSVKDIKDPYVRRATAEAILERCRNLTEKEYEELMK